MATVTNRISGDHQIAPTSSCFQKTSTLKWADIALIAGCAALLIIGILASTGVLNCIGTTNAAYLSYGMYAGAALLLLAESIKCVVSRHNTNNKHNVKALTDEQLQKLNKDALTALQQDWQMTNTEGQITNETDLYIVANMEKCVHEITGSKAFRKDPEKYIKTWIAQTAAMRKCFDNENHDEALIGFNKKFIQLRKMQKRPTHKIKSENEAADIIALEGVVFVSLAIMLKDLGSKYESDATLLKGEIERLVSNEYGYYPIGLFTIHTDRNRH